MSNEDLSAPNSAFSIQHSEFPRSPAPGPCSCHRNQRNRPLVGRDRQLRGKLLGGRAECPRGGRLRLANGNRDAGIASDSDRFVNRNPPEERDRQLACEGLATALAEDIALVLAARADEVTHVFN